MAKRKYTKKSDYWGKFDKVQGAPVELDSFEPEILGTSLYESEAASCRTTKTTSNSTRTNRAATKTVAGRFANIKEGLLPFEFSKDGVDASEAIVLCQKAYFNIPAFRSTIDLMSEYADSEVYLEGGSQKSRKFVEAWFKRIKIHDLQAQYFREFYRSGNVLC